MSSASVTPVMVSAPSSRMYVWAWGAGLRVTVPWIRVRSSIIVGAEMLSSCRETELLLTTRLGRSNVSTARTAGPTISRMASEVRRLTSSELPDTASWGATSLELLATLIMEFSMFRPSSIEGGAMLSMLEWHEEIELRSSEDRDPSPEPPRALLTATGTEEPNLPLIV